jgi:hypothetical protein
MGAESARRYLKISGHSHNGQVREAAGSEMRFPARLQGADSLRVPRLAANRQKRSSQSRILHAWHSSLARAANLTNGYVFFLQEEPPDFYRGAATVSLSRTSHRKSPAAPVGVPYGPRNFCRIGLSLLDATRAAMIQRRERSIGKARRFVTPAVRPVRACPRVSRRSAYDEGDCRRSTPQTRIARRASG